MLNWLKRLFKKKDQMIEIQISKEGLDSIRQTRIKIDEFRKRSRKMVNENYSFKEIYADESAISEQFRKAKAMTKRKYFGKLKGYDYYTEIKSGVDLKIGDYCAKYNIDDKLDLFTAMFSEYSMVGPIENIIYKDFEIDINKTPSPERKEMEYYKISDFNTEKFTFDEVNKTIRNTVFYYEQGQSFIKIDSKSCIRVLCDNKWGNNYFERDSLRFGVFRLAQEIYPPRTLKLEDLKTLWLKKSSGGKILRINTFDKENVYLTPLVHMGYHESQSIKSFFDDFREATQTDIDNLTKGN